MAKKTLTYSEIVKGWTSFFSYQPDILCKLNNRFFSIKDGQLYLHNDQTNPVMNNFYGVQYSSQIDTVINEANSDDKIFKTMVLEGNNSWNVAVKTNMANSTVKSTEFNQRESRHFAYLRKNEDSSDLHGNAAQGIGVIVSFTGLKITFSSVSDFVSVGDQLYQLNGSVKEFIGVITMKEKNVLTLDSFEKTPVAGFYSFSKKNARIEGGEIRGYYMEVALTSTGNSKSELFAIESNVIKSYV